jgi:hypothetical protein
MIVTELDARSDTGAESNYSCTACLIGSSASKRIAFFTTWVPTQSALQWSMAAKIVTTAAKTSSRTLTPELAAIQLHGRVPLPNSRAEPYLPFILQSKMIPSEEQDTTCIRRRKSILHPPVR